MTDHQYFFRTFKYVKPYAVLYAIGIFFYSAQAFFMPLLNGLALGGVMEGIIALDFSVVRTALLRLAMILIIYMCVLGVGVYLYVSTIAYARRDLTIHLFRAFMKSSLENEKHSGEGIAALNADVGTATNIVDNALSPFLSTVIAAVFASVTIFIINWRLGIGAIAVGAIVFVLQARFAAPLAELGKQRLEANADSVKAMSNIFAGALTIRAFSRHDQSLFVFDKENGKLKKIAFKQAFIGMWQNMFTTVQGWLAMVLVFALGGWLVANGHMELPQLMIVFPMADTVGGAMSQIGAAYAGLQPPIVAAKRVFDVIDAVPDLDKPHVNNIDNWNGDSTINLNKLSFAYKNADKDALKGIDLTIGKNQMVAFVGESGSGKSTLLRLIIGMYEREDLGMEIGNMHFTAENLKEWRKHFAYVDQTCKLFDMSIAENIAMGKQGTATQEEISAAAHRAFADEFITALQDGYDTECGEKGASLSGGQKQRIAIARALCRKAQVLVFDEATSALDAESERNIMQTIETLRQDHTILITTHNLHNIKTSDKIVVMDNGNIAEVGTHAELMDKGGIYKRLLEEQHAV